MKRNNCNLKLELQPPVSDHESTTEEEQKLTIFYDGQVCVCDVSEFQARAILLLASRELNMEEKMKSPAASSSSGDTTANYGPPGSSPTASAATTGLSMQRSLQRFLQKRKHRSHVAAAHPYQR